MSGRPGPVRVLELRSVRGTGGGPEKTILLSAAQADPAVCQVMVCYIRDRRDETFMLGERARALGVDYLEVEERHSVDPGVLPKLAQVIRNHRIDLVHAHEYKTDLLALLLARRTGVVPLATAHGWTGQSLRERLVYYPVDKRLLARFARVVAVSTEIKREIVRHGASPDRVDVVLNSIDPSAFRRDPSRQPIVRAALGLPADAIVIGAVGRVERQKRFDVLLDAIAPAARAQPNLRVVIVGDGSLLEALRHQAARAAIAPQCLFLGQRTDVAELHHAFDLFVQSSEYEGTPNAVLEAMALETPIVATDVGGTGELARDRLEALLVPSRDIIALREAIDAALGDPRSRRERVLSARRRVEHDLSFNRRRQTVERIYVEMTRA